MFESTQDLQVWQMRSDKFTAFFIFMTYDLFPQDESMALS